MATNKGEAKAAPASVSVSLSDHNAVSALLTSIRGIAQEKADSVRISVRGSSSAVVELLGRFKDPELHVSAVLTLRGDVPTLE